MTATHSIEHTHFHENCYLCKLRSVSITPAATPTRRDVRYKATDDLEKGWQKDLPAYKTLVKDGLQPDTVDGAHELMMRAETKTEIEEGTIHTPEERKASEAASELIGVVDG